MSDVPLLRTSERAAFQRCIWRWWMGYRQGLATIDSASKTALWFGTGVHIALAKWYTGPGLKRGAHPAETWSAWSLGELQYIKTQARRDNGIIEETLVPARELGLAMLEGYVQKYGKDDNWWVIEPEHAGQINVMDPHDPALLLLIYAFTYDLVYRDLKDDWIKLGEHKTAKAIQADHLPLDRQGGSYWAIATNELRASGLIKPKESIRGIEYNFLRKSLPDSRPTDAQGYATNTPNKSHYLEALAGYSTQDLGKLKLDELAEMASLRKVKVTGDRSKRQPSPLFVREFVRRTANQRAAQIRHIQDEALHMAYVREGYLPLTKNPTRDCQWDCDFYNMCMLDEAGGDWREYRDNVFVVRDPYSDHRKSTESGM